MNRARSRGGLRMRIGLWLSALACMPSLAACSREADLRVDAGQAPDPSVMPCVAIPEAGEWSYVGRAFESGAEGEFDRLLWGGFGGSALRLADEVLLYYQGAAGYSEAQQSVTYRTLGLAVSRDGRAFAKFPGNPVLDWSPNAGDEEGAVSAAAAVGPAGEVVVFYGANSMTGPTTVSGDVRWATSLDGRSFTDHGVALDHRDDRVQGWGDELFPVIAFFHGQNWYVYYLPNGNGWRGELAVAVGPGPDRLTQTAALREGFQQLRAWGMQSAAHLCGHRYALFLNGERPDAMTVRVVDASTPSSASRPVAVYRFEADVVEQGFSQGTILLDRQTGYWYLLHRDEKATGYGILRAAIRLE